MAREGEQNLEDQQPRTRRFERDLGPVLPGSQAHIVAVYSRTHRDGFSIWGLGRPVRAREAHLTGACRRPPAYGAEGRRGQLPVSAEHVVDVVRVEPKDPATPVGGEDAFGDLASNGLHAHAHPGSSGG